MRHVRARTLAVVLWILLAAPLAGHAQVETALVVYTVIDLGPLTHPNQEDCFDRAPGATIQNVGVGDRAVGSTYREGERAVAALFSSSGDRQMVSGEGGGRANAINASGQIAGAVFAELPDEVCGEPAGSAPASWNDAFEIEMLELPDGVAEGAAVAINQGGEIAGWILTDDGRRAALWSDAGLVIIEHISVDHVMVIESEAVAINDDGLIAGTVRWARDGVEETQAFVWDGANTQYLESGPGSDGFATSMNNDGVVSGAIVDETGVRMPVLWWRGQVVDLGPLSDRPHAVVTDVNNAGFAVGYGEREDGLSRAMTWIGGVPIDLNSITPDELGWQLQIAVGINDDGVIAGWGDLDGERRAFLLVPAVG